MTDLPTPERRAELRGLPGRDTLTDAELTALLDATEPVGDAEAARAAQALHNAAFIVHDNALYIEAAALIERQARELAEVRAAFPDYRRDPCNQPENMR
jgi:RecB family exonuclease